MKTLLTPEHAMDAIFVLGSAATVVVTVCIALIKLVSGEIKRHQRTQHVKNYFKKL